MILLLCFICIEIRIKKMLVLFETPGGYALFKVLDEGKLEDGKKIFEQFESPEKATSL